MSAPSAAAAGDGTAGATATAAKAPDPLVDVLLHKLRVVPHHAISLRRNKYRVIRRVAKQMGWDIMNKDKDASFFWLDKWETNDMTNLRFGKVGHFLGMRDVSSKCSLGRTLNRTKQEFPADYEFHPVTFVLPTDKERLLAYASAYASASAAMPSGKKAAAKFGGPAGVEALMSKLPASTSATLLSGGLCSGAQSAAYFSKLKRGTTATAGDGDPLAPPEHGCWPSAGWQAQPLASAGDRLTYIVKPDASSRGNGIYLALTLDDIKELASADDDGGGGAGPRAASAGGSSGGVSTDSGDSDSDGEAHLQKLTLVQTYIPRPLLVDNRKFDLRIYVMVTSAFPTMRVFIYRQGLVRFATEDYQSPDESNVRRRKMFLTNYAVNKATEAGTGKPGGAGMPDDQEESDEEDEKASAAAVAVARGGAGTTAAGGARTGGVDADDDAGGGSDSGGSDTGGSSDEEGDDDAAGSGAAARPKGSSSKKAAAAASSKAPGAPHGPPIVGANVPGGLGWPSMPSRSKLRDMVRGRVGCKWSLDELLCSLDEQGIDSDRLWHRIKDVITKTMLAVRPSMAQKYRAARPAVKKEDPPPMPAPPRKRAARSLTATSRLYNSSRTLASPPGAAAAVTPAADDSMAAAIAAAGGGAYGGAARWSPRSGPGGAYEMDALTAAVAAVTAGAGGHHYDSGAGGVSMHGGYAGGQYQQIASPYGYPPSGAAMHRPGAGGMPVAGGAGGVMPPYGVPPVPAAGPLARRSLSASALQPPRDGSASAAGMYYDPSTGYASASGMAGASGPTSGPRAGVAAAGRTGGQSAALSQAGRSASGTASPASGGGMDLLGFGISGTSVTLSAAPAATTRAVGRLGGGSGTMVGPSALAASAGRGRSTAVAAGRGGGMIAGVGGASPASSVSSGFGVVGGTYGVPATSASSPAGGFGGPLSAASATLHINPSAAKPPMPTTLPPRSADASSSSAAAATDGTGSANSTPGRPPPSTRKPAASASAAGGAAPGDLEEDGEQGFRCYELMGLDIILDMSHCTCECSGEYQRLSSKPAARWPAGVHRCQPRPVLLEINQSCSLHSDSELDKVIKGDVVTDAFALAAPDETWLLQRFKEVLDLRPPAAPTDAGSISSADSAAAVPATSTASTPAADASAPTSARSAASDASTAAPATAADYDPAVDAQRMSRARFNAISERWCFDDMPRSHATNAAYAESACLEAETLLSLFPSKPPAAATVASPATDGTGSGATPTPASAPASTAATAAPSTLKSGLQATNLGLTPWIPAPSRPIPQAMPVAWAEEQWFGGGSTQAAVAAAAATPSPAASDGADAGTEAGPLPSPRGTGASSPAGAASKSPAAAAGAGTGKRDSAATSSSTASSSPSQPAAVRSSYTLDGLPPLSRRAQLVLMLRRIYEHAHIGGFERLAPPTSGPLADRYRRIAEYIPPPLRETAAFARRRQEALAIRAAMEAKKPTPIR